MSIIFKYRKQNGERIEVRNDGIRNDGFREGYWITRAGTPVHINKEGLADMGAGGKFNGQPMCGYKMAHAWGYGEDECPMCGQKVAHNETMFNNAMRFKHRPINCDLSREKLESGDFDVNIINTPRNVLKFLNQFKIWGEIQTAREDMPSEFDNEYVIHKGDKYFSCHTEDGDVPYSLRLIVEYASLPMSIKARTKVLKEIVANNDFEEFDQTSEEIENEEF